ncbi:hypothetical protein [Bradyrhizobium elkanii]|uniref:hypothetical protein n=1 Tax=Bradyrhizobium elkanii TaxID=29448 RepID=UPI00209F5006|nr:hypothetical protein [Bradyrhizobium elkanii]MCP1927566.1 hypothetical protein [Bradyrhizobium elkanii]
MSTYVTGFTRDAKSQNVVEFASDLAPDTWISIPRGLIENIKELPGKAAQGAHIRVGIKLAEPTSPEGKVFAALTDGLNTAIVSLSRKVAPALDSTGKATHASDSCIRCLEACKLIVLPPDDPFAPRVTSNSSGCGRSNSSTREAGQGTVSLSLFPGQELQRLL